MKLGYWIANPIDPTLRTTFAELERLGVDSVWCPEAYGSDCLTPLAWWGATTSTLRLGTGIVQMAARTPTATAMAALTMDHLTGGRFLLGMGASGPQVVEGWYGQPFARLSGERRRRYSGEPRAPCTAPNRGPESIAAMKPPRTSLKGSCSLRVLVTFNGVQHLQR